MSIRILAISVVVIGMGSAVASADLMNSDFGTGDLTGWDTNAGGEVSVVPILGNPAALLEETLSADRSALMQTFNIDSGATVVLSFTFRFVADVSDFDPFAAFPEDALLVSLFDAMGDPLLSNPFVTDFLFVSLTPDPFPLGPLTPVTESATGVSLFDLEEVAAGDFIGLAGRVEVDVTAFAGMTATLDFSLVGGFDGLESSATVDDIQIVATPIPAPAAALLGCLGLMCVEGMRRRTRRGFVEASKV